MPSLTMVRRGQFSFPPKLGIYGPEESLALRTICQDVQTVTGAAVSFQISPVTQPQKLYSISSAFTAERLGLADHSYPLSILEKYQHLNNLLLQSFEGVRPLLLNGADDTHLFPHITCSSRPLWRTCSYSDKARMDIAGTCKTLDRSVINTTVPILVLHPLRTTVEEGCRKALADQCLAIPL